MTHPRRAFLAFVLAAILAVIAVTAIVTKAISPEQVIGGFAMIGRLAQWGVGGWIARGLLGVVLDYAARVQTTAKAEPVAVNRKVREDAYQVNTRPTKAERVVV